MGNSSPNSASLSLSKAAGAPPRLCRWLDASTAQPSWAVGQSVLTGARVQPLSPLKLKKAQHTVEVKHPN